jgi:hypothetical protein
MFKESSLTNLFILFAPFAIGLLIAMLLPGAIRNPAGYATAALIFYGIGFASFAAAKTQNIRRGHLLSFGSSKMTTTWKWAYRIGYVLMVIGLVLTMVLGVVAKFNT